MKTKLANISGSRKVQIWMINQWWKHDSVFAIKNCLTTTN